jgi:hypothetical protein
MKYRATFKFLLSIALLVWTSCFIYFIYKECDGLEQGITLFTFNDANSKEEGREKRSLKKRIKPSWGDKMKVLFLTHAYNYESGTSRHFFRQYEAALRYSVVCS